MSIESAKSFLERMKNDEDFAKKMMAAPNAETFVELARVDGFDFTAVEFEQSRDELTDSELDSVHGGARLGGGPSGGFMPLGSNAGWQI